MKKVILTVLCSVMLFATTFAESVDIVHSDGSATRITATDRGYTTEISTREVSSYERKSEQDMATAAGVVALAVTFPTATAVVVGTGLAIWAVSAIFGD